MKTEPNEPINAIVEDNNYEGQLISEARFNGLTKREYFAALIIQGLSANTDWSNNSSKEIARAAVVTADALIEQLNQ